MSPEFPCLTSAIQDYRAVEDLHIAAFNEVLEQCGEDDVEQIERLHAAAKFFRMGTELMRAVVARAEETTPQSPERLSYRTPEPSRESRYFPRWRV